MIIKIIIVIIIIVWQTGQTGSSKGDILNAEEVGDFRV